jgi:hypothetical protein
MVLQNSVIFGSVNANRYHYELAAEALAQANPGWLAALITCQIPLDQWEDAYARRSKGHQGRLDLRGCLTPGGCDRPVVPEL